MKELKEIDLHLKNYENSGEFRDAIQVVAAAEQMEDQKEMKAFHNSPEIKQKYLDRVLAHKAADEIIKGTYWEKGKGCAVGCTLHSDDHKAYETEMGIPEWLARIEDRVFEGLPDERAEEWPAEFLSAINIGADLEKIKAPFLIFVLESARENFDHIRFPQCKAAIDQVIELYRSGETNLEKFREARRTAADAAYAAYAAYAAADAADAAAAAVYAAYAAAAAADADAAADAAAAAAVYAAASRSNSYVKFADKLLELIRECKARARVEAIAKGETDGE